MRYLYSEADHPLSIDYYYECTQTTNIDSFPHVPAHTHNYYEIYVYRSGSVRLSVEEQCFEVQSGDVVMIPPYTVHKLEPIGENSVYDRIYMHLTEPCLASLQFNNYSLLKPFRMASEEKHYHFHISSKEDYDRIYERMFELYRSKKEDYYGKELLNRARITEIVTLINKYIMEDITPRSNPYQDKIVSGILTFINEHYQEDISLSAIAQMFGVNKVILAQMFKEQTGLTLHHYIRIKRIDMAKQVMMDGMPPTEVSFVVGYKDYSSFYRAFVAQEEISPKEFLNLLKESSV